MNKQTKNSGIRSGNGWLGGLLILLGLVFVLRELFDIRIGQFIWPFFVIGPGVLLFLLALALDEDSG